MSSRIPGESNISRVIGILLAAGRGRRMGRTKQLLPWPAPDGPGTVVAAAFDAMADACHEMIVVVGHEVQAVIEALGPRAFRAVKSDANAAMFESVRSGLESAHRSDPAAAVLLHPADCPAIAPSTPRCLLKARAEQPDLVLIPEFEGRGGHPVLIPPALIPALLEYSGEGGLRQYWADHPRLCRRVTVDDAGVIRDLDTPDDYAAR